MNISVQDNPVKRMLVVLPTWLGDTVMATPTLRALRALYPDAQIAGLCRRSVRPILDGCPWLDRIATVRPRRGRLPKGGRSGPFKLARRISAGNFDAVVLLPNSFRAALLARMAGIPRRIGYDRDGRGFLLTDLLLPRREGGRFIPVSTRDYYLGIACYLGSVDPDPTMQLFTRPEDDQRAQQFLARAGYDVSGDRPLVIINPGANYGEAKLWLADRFAAVADRCVKQFGAVVGVSGAPSERQIIQSVISAAREPLLDLPAMGMDLTMLKSVLKLSRLMITNDTGPRHMAAAFDVPVVTVFGPTDPAWSDTRYAKERSVSVEVFCGPCQKKRCPLDHRCMTGIESDTVFAEAERLLESSNQVRTAI